MFGVLVNTFAILIGSLIGLIFKKGIPEKYTNTIFTGVGLSVLFIGISGTLKDENVLVMIISMVLGSIIGTWIDLDLRFNQLGEFIGKKFKSKDEHISVSEGFVSASLLFCVGAMAIVGSLEAGLTHKYDTLFTKSVLDFISSAVLTVTLGFGVALSAFSVLIYQGVIVLLSQFLDPFLTDLARAEIISVGSLIIVALGFNMIGVTKIKIANYLPAIIIAPIIAPLIVWVTHLV